MRPDDLPAIAHDPAALEAFYRDNVEAVQRFVARRVADPRLAADLTAEVFVAAIDAAPGYQARRGVPAAWLYGIARNVVSSEHRRAAREHRAHADLAGRRLLDDEDILRMQERIDAEARARDLHAAVAGLPDGERAIFELTALDGLSPAEAAAVLGIHAVAARVRLHRARTRLRGVLSSADDQSLSIRPLEARP